MKQRENLIPQTPIGERAPQMPLPIVIITIQGI